MSDVRAFHPGTGAEVLVPEESMFHLRQSGWLLAEENEANQAAAEAAGKPAAKSAAKSDEEK